jgi:hypothetical protein
MYRKEGCHVWTRQINKNKMTTLEASPGLIRSDTKPKMLRKLKQWTVKREPVAGEPQAVAPTG